MTDTPQPSPHVTVDLDVTSDVDVTPLVEALAALPFAAVAGAEGYQRVSVTYCPTGTSVSDGPAAALDDVGSILRDLGVGARIAAVESVAAEEMDRRFPDATLVDWRDLFARYAAHVGMMEGADFLDRWYVGEGDGDLCPVERAAIDELMARA